MCILLLPMLHKWCVASFLWSTTASGPGMQELRQSAWDRGYNCRSLLTPLCTDNLLTSALIIEYYDTRGSWIYTTLYLWGDGVSDGWSSCIPGPEPVVNHRNDTTHHLCNIGSGIHTIPLICALSQQTELLSTCPVMYYTYL